MNSDFARDISRATASVRAQNLAEATAIIQAALRGTASMPEAGPPAPTRTRAPFRIAPEVEDAEVVDDRASPRRPVRTAGRQSLREVVDLLRAGRTAFDGLDVGLPGGVARPPAPALPEGASFTWRSHASDAGARRYRLFVPSCPTAELRGLVLMLHGCKQDPDDFAAGTGMNALAEEQRLIVAYPAQPGSANVSGCWNWFDPAHQGRASGEPAVLAALVRELVAEFRLPPDRVFVAGLSAGGAMAAVLAETHPDLFAAVGIHSGLPFGSANDVVSAFAAMRGSGRQAAARSRMGNRPRIIVFHGTADRTVHPGNAEAIAEGARGAPPAAVSEHVETATASGYGWRRTRVHGPADVASFELWLIDGAGHAWSGGHPSGSFTDPRGPSASAEMLRFFAAGGS